MSITLEEISSKDQNVKKGEFKEMLESTKSSKRFSDLSALVVDATDTEHWDIFKFFQRHALHLGAVSVASLLYEMGFGDVKAVYEVLTPDFDYSELNPDLIGVSAIIANIPFANEKIRYFRRANPGALILAGGAGYFFNPELAVEAGADAVVKGKGEDPVLELMNRLAKLRKEGESLRDVFLRTDVSDIQGVYTGKGNVEAAEQIMLDDMPPINYKLIQGKQSKFIRTVMSSDGCTVLKCGFCAAKKLNSMKYRFNSTGVIIEKLRQAEEDGVVNVFIADDHFLGRGYPRLVELTDAIQEEGLTVGWSAQVTIKSIYDHLEEGIVERLRRSNCTGLYIGVESIYDDDLEQINASKKTSNEMAIKVFEALRNIISLHAMCVLKPVLKKKKEGEAHALDYGVENTEKGIEMYWRKVMHMVDVLKYYNVRTAQFHSAVPLPGADITPEFFEEGIVLKTVGGEAVDWSKYTGQYVVASANPSASNKIMMDAYRRFYSVSSVIWPIIKGIFLPWTLRRNFMAAYLRNIGRKIINRHSQIEEYIRYNGALEMGDFEFYKHGEKFFVG